MTLIEQIQQYNAELLRFRCLLDEAFAKGAKNSSKAEDHIVFPLLVSARDMMEEIALRLKYVPSDVVKAQFEQCKQDFINIGGYPAHI
jgi:hypothetical protein